MSGTTTFRQWLRTWGLSMFGYAEENFHGHHQIIRVWGLFQPARWEVYRWAVGTGSDDMDKWMRPLRRGSAEAYHRIQLSAECVYKGGDWKAAKRAFGGAYPDGTTDKSRRADGENCPQCHRFECSSECIAAEQVEIDGYNGPTPEKFA